MDASSSGRRPRPLADAPVADGRDIAKAWLLGLLADAPLEAAGAVPAAELARDAPALATAIVRALCSDAELARLEPGGDLAELASRAGTLGGATAPAGAIRAIEALRRAAWAALTTDLATPDPSLVADLANRLAHVCAVIAQASLGAAPPADDRARCATDCPPTGAPSPARSPADLPTGAPAPARPPADLPVARPPAAPGDHVRPAAPPTDVAPLDGSPGPRNESPRSAHAAGETRGEPVSPAHAAGETRSEPAPPAEPDRIGHAPPPAPADRLGAPSLDGPVAAHDARPHDSAGWRAAIDRRLERHASDGRPFAVLLVEVDDLDRLVEAMSDSEMAVALEKVERAVCEELRPADVLERERAGRYWLTTPDTGPAGARELGERVAVAVAGAAEHRGVPLTASIGVAVCPEDGADAEALAAHADEGVWAARAAGVRIA